MVWEKKLLGAKVLILFLFRLSLVRPVNPANIDSVTASTWLSDKLRSLSRAGRPNQAGSIRVRELDDKLILTRFRKEPKAPSWIPVMPPWSILNRVTEDRLLLLNTVVLRFPTSVTYMIRVENPGM